MTLQINVTSDCISTIFCYRTMWNCGLFLIYFFFSFGSNRVTYGTKERLWEQNDFLSFFFAQTYVQGYYKIQHGMLFRVGFLQYYVTVLQIIHSYLLRTVEPWLTFSFLSLLSPMMTSLDVRLHEEPALHLVFAGNIARDDAMHGWLCSGSSCWYQDSYSTGILRILQPFSPFFSAAEGKKKNEGPFFEPASESERGIRFIIRREVLWVEKLHNLPFM